ncbi:unnamed protein product [Cochlearia groenlandica]
MSVRDLVTWNALIDGYARCGDVKIAQKMFDEIPDDRDTYSWTALLHDFSKWGEIEAARDVFDKMSMKNLVSWNAMINGIESALSAFESIRRKKLGHWNSVIVGAIGMHGMAQEAFQLFKQMQERRIKRNAVTFVGLLKACSHGEYVKEARSL